MAQQFTANPIQTPTKGDLHRLRNAGYVPISVQHRGWETLHLQMEARPLDEFLRHHSASTLLELVIAPNNKRQPAMIQAIQRDPISQRLLQVTFQAVVRGEAIKAHIPVSYQGEPDLVRERTAVVQIQLEQVEIRCLPHDLPDHITVDISHLTLDSPLRVSDIPANSHYEVLTSPDAVMVTLTRLSAPTAEAEEKEAAAAEAAGEIPA
jgi:large subunit ribosomal protein L25